MKTKEYIGDGVYVRIRPFDIVLTTENGLEVTNEIFIEPEVWKRLNEFLKANNEGWVKE